MTRTHWIMAGVAVVAAWFLLKRFRASGGAMPVVAGTQSGTDPKKTLAGYGAGLGTVQSGTAAQELAYRNMVRDANNRLLGL